MTHEEALDVADMMSKLRAQLAAVTAERDALRKRNAAMLHTLESIQDYASDNINSLSLRLTDELFEVIQNEYDEQVQP